MNKEDLLIGIYKDEAVTADSIVESQINGLANGFCENGIKTIFIGDEFDYSQPVNLTIAIDTNGVGHWQKFLSNNITNIVWNSSSVFYSNFQIIEQFANYERFILFNPTQDDIEPVKNYFPSLLQGYIPFGTDLNLWNKNDAEKTRDLIIFANVIDIEDTIKLLKEKMPELVFSLMMDYCELAVNYPALSMWQITQIFKKQLELELDVSQYQLIAQNISEIITTKQFANMMKLLDGFELTVVGNGPLQKYVPSSAKIINSNSIFERAVLLNSSKIALQLTPYELCGGINVDTLNSAAAKALVLTGDNKTIYAEFGDSAVYCNSVNYEDLPEKINYYLKNTAERNKKTDSAFKTVKNHTWTKRAASILDIID